MKCLNKQIKTIEIKEGYHGEKTIKTKTDFGECIGHECPYYDTKITYVVEGAIGKYVQKATCRMVG
jgi:hypothetical protein